jgi:hypothetical protein
MDRFRLITLAHMLLAAAGRADSLMTVQQIADAVGISCEAVRVWFRRGEFGFFSSESGRYYAAHSEVCAFMESHWGHVPKRLLDFEFTQSRSGVKGFPMTEDGKGLRSGTAGKALDPYERDQLKKLLLRASVDDLTDTPAAELRQAAAEHDRLRKQEAAASDRLSALRSALDESTTRLDQLIRGAALRQRSRPQLAGTLAKLSVALRGQLPRLAERDGFDPADIDGFLQACVEDHIPGRGNLQEFLGIAEPRKPIASGDKQKDEPLVVTADQIIAAGKKRRAEDEKK